MALGAGTAGGRPQVGAGTWRGRARPERAEPRPQGPRGPGSARTALSSSRRAEGGPGQAGQSGEPKAGKWLLRPQPWTGGWPGAALGGRVGLWVGFHPVEIRRNCWTQPPGTQEGIREMASEGRPCVCSCPRVGGCPRVSSRVHACVFARASECGTPCMFMSVSPCVHTCIHVCVPVVSCGVPGIWVTYLLSPTVCPCVPASVCVHVGLGASRVWRLGSGSQEEPA